MQEKLRRFMTTQFGNLRGIFGKIIGNRMAKGNSYDAQWTVSLLNIQPYHHILEIGLGPGVSPQLSSEKTSKGFVAGIDHTTPMFQTAGQRSAAAILFGLMELKHREVSSFPYRDPSFDIPSS